MVRYISVWKRDRQYDWQVGWGRVREQEPLSLPAFVCKSHSLPDVLSSVRKGSPVVYKVSQLREMLSSILNYLVRTRWGGL